MLFSVRKKEGEQGRCEAERYLSRKNRNSRVREGTPAGAHLLTSAGLRHLLPGSVPLASPTQPRYKVSGKNPSVLPAHGRLPWVAGAASLPWGGEVGFCAFPSPRPSGPCGHFPVSHGLTAVCADPWLSCWAGSPTGACIFLLDKQVPG